MSSLSPLFFDLETYYDENASLKKLSTWEYVVHPAVEPQCLIWAEGDGPVQYVVFDKGVGGPQLREKLVELRYSERVVVAHNGAFDFPVVRYFCGLTPFKAVCTMLMDTYYRGTMAREVKASERTFLHNQGLEDVWQSMCNGSASMPRYTKNREGLEQVMGGHPHDLSPEQFALYGEYCLSDVTKLRDIFRVLLLSLPDSRKYAINWAMQQMCDPILKLDYELIDREQHHAQVRMEQTLERLNIKPETLRSGNKFAELMDSIYPGGWPRVPSPSDENKLIPLISKAHPQWQHIHASSETQPDVVEVMNLRQEVTGAGRDKRYGRYSKIAKALNGWFPIHVVASGAHTHRLTGGAGSGGNPLNWVKGSPVREAVMAPPGYKLICADYSQAELRIARWMARDARSMGAVLQGTDMYVDFYCNTFSVHPEQVTPEQRQLAKIGELSCLPVTTRVLTGRGYVPILDVSADDVLWDGVEWVKHGGVVYQGNKKCIQYDNVVATRDHVVFTHNGPMTLERAAVNGETIHASATLEGTPLRIMDRHRPMLPEERVLDGALSLRSVRGLRARARRQLTLVVEAVRSQGFITCLQSLRDETATAGIETASPQVFCCEASVHQPQRPWLRQVRGSGDSLRVRQSDGRRDMVCKEVSGLAGQRDRPQRQRRSLLESECSSSHLSREQFEQANQLFHDPSRHEDTHASRAPRSSLPLPGAGLLRHLLRHFEKQEGATHADSSEGLSPKGEARQAERTYDILNAGPRHRFTVYPGRLVSNCQFGAGANRLSQSLGIEPLVAERLVQTFRKIQHPELPRVWAFLQAVLRSWCNGAEVDPALIKQHMNLPPGMKFLAKPIPKVVFPSGTTMYYHMLRPLADGMVYSRRGAGLDANIYGALFWENCIAKDTLVVTDAGLIAIQSVTNEMRVWDGVEWCSHDGLVCRGEQETMLCHGVRMTPDHEVLTVEGFKEANDAVDTPRYEVPLPAGLRRFGREVVQAAGTRREVFDILNAGERHRFTVIDDEGKPLVVSNCVQGLSNEVIWTAQQQIEEQLGLRVAYQCYDELMIVCPEHLAEEYAPKIQHIMETCYRSTWPEMPPMEAQPQIVDRYSEAK